jgi:hypothetical protein
MTVLTKMENKHNFITPYRIWGLFFIICSILGFIFVADELHHFGEFIGVACILAAGIIMLFVESKIKIFKRLALQWVSFGLLISIPVGGILLDNMLLGSGIGLTSGIFLAYLFGKHKVTKSS